MKYKKSSKFCVGGRGDASCTSLEQHVVQSSADGCQDTVGLVMLSARLGRRCGGEREKRRGRERKGWKNEGKKKQPAARSHVDCVSGVINRGLFASTAGTSVASVADKNRKWKVGVFSYPASPCKLLFTAVSTCLPPL